MNIIDELIVSLSLDPSKFQKGQKEAVDSLKKLEDQAKRGGANIEKSAGGVEQSFAVLQKRLLGIGALLFGGLSIDKFIEKMTRLNVATANLSANIGVSSQALQAWANVGERFGVSGGAVQQTFQSLAQQAAAYRNNRANLPQLFQFQQGANSAVGKIKGAQGVQVFGQNGDMLPPEEVLTRLNKWLGNETKFGRGTEARQALRQYGGLNDDTITLLGKSAKELNAALEQAKKLAPNDEQVKRFEELNKATETAKQSLEALGRDLTDTVLPQLTEFANFISKIVGFWRGDPETKNQVNKEGNDLSSRLRKKFGEPPEWLRGNDYDNLKGGRPNRAIEENTQELRKLNEKLKGGVQQQGFNGGDFGSSGRIINAMFGGGGAEFGGGVGGGSGGSGGGLRRGGNQNGVGEDVPVGTGKFDRTHFSKEFSDPDMQRRLATIVFGEGGHKQSVKQAMGYLESIANRATTRNQTLAQATRMWPGPGGYYPASTFRNGKPSAAELKWFQEKVLPGVAAGSDVSTEMFGFPTTGNASGGVASRGIASGKYTRHFTNRAGETFVQERRDNIRRLEGTRIKRDAGSPMPSSNPAGGYNDSLNLLGASKLAAYMPGHDGGISSSTSMSIGNIHIHTAATDGPGIASTIGPAIKRFASISSANNGPT